MSDEVKLQWWAISAGTPDGKQGENDGRIRAGDEQRARELYLSQRPASWEIFTIEPGEAPEVRDPLKVAEATARRIEREIAARRAAE